MSLLKFLLSFFALLICLATNAQKPFLELNDNTQNKIIWGNGVDILQDSTEHLGLQQVIDTYQSHFKSTRNLPSDLGFKKGCFWLRIKIRKNTSKSFMLVNNYSMIDGLSYFLLNDKNEVIDSSNISKSFPIYQRSLTVHQCAIALQIPHNQIFTIYIKINGTDTKRFNLRIVEHHQFYETYLDQLWYWAGHIGFVICMIFVQLIFWSISGRKHFQLYFWYLLSYLSIVIVGGYGFIDNFLWPHNQWLKRHGIVLVTLLSSVFGMLFYSDVLRLKVLVPFLYRITLFFVGAIIVCGLWVFIWPYIMSPNSFTSLISVLFFVITMISCWISHIRGNKTAIYYFFGTVFFLLGSIANLAWTENYLKPDSWVVNAFYIGSTFEMLFFTLALANDYKNTRLEREKSNQTLIKTLQTQNQEISEALLRGQTLERKRVAADLHDSLGGTLSALSWTLSGMDAKKLNEHEQQIYSNLVEMTNDAYQKLRFLSHNLLPEDLENEGITKNLERLIQKLNHRGKTIFNLQTNLLDPIEAQTQFEIYNICLELINNVLKHAEATTTTLSLQQFNEHITINITDNGKGFEVNKENGKGLGSVQNRVSSLGGKYKVTSSSDGTTITISVPNDNSKSA